MELSVHPLHHFNPWAILVSALILWMLGAVWYSPALFAKPWMSALGIVPDPSNKKDGLVKGMIASLLCDVLVAFVLAHAVMWAGAERFHGGAFVGFVCWFGFIAATQFPQGIYEGRPTRLFWINSGYWLVGLPIIGGVIAVWH